MTDNTLLLVDGSSFLYRAFHALPDLRNRQGEPAGAIYGMVGMLRRLRGDSKLNGGATHGAVIFDAPGKTFREDWYPEYKAHRAAMPEDLRSQIPAIHQMVRALGWPLVMVEGIEADDVIATLARQARAQQMRTVVSTGDKDLAQLVSDEVVLVNTMVREGQPSERLDRDGVIAKFGVPPERIIDYLSLVGDTVDNVPGVEKVGPKTAVKWLTQYGSLEAVMAHAGEIGGVVGENLRRALDWLPMARKLVTVRDDCDLAGHVDSLQALQLRDQDLGAMRDLCERYGFRTWLREIEAQIGGSAAPGASSALPSAAASTHGDTQGAAGMASAAAKELLPELSHELVLTQEALERWAMAVEAAELVAVDTETNSLDPMSAELVGVSLAIVPGQGCYIPVAHHYAGAPSQLSREQVLSRLRGWLEDSTRPKVGQHLKYDAHVFANHGIELRGVAHDTMLESYVLEPHRSHDMDSLALRHLDRRTVTFEEVAGKGASQITFDQVPLQEAARYAAEDAEVTMHLHRVLYPRIAGDAKLEHVYRNIEMPTSVVLQKMERAGVLIDCELLARQSEELGQKMQQTQTQAFEAAGGAFNLGSPKQLGELLFVRQGLPVVKKTPSGAPSTDEEVLAKLAEDYPLPRLVLQWRTLAKLKSTYVDKLPRMVNPRTGRVHTSYAQAVAVTGRLASNEPNLQNIPIRTAEGRRVREAFIAGPDQCIISADYSQIELRIMAHISQDPGLLQAFAQGLDVHRATASEVFGVPLDAVTSEQRRYAKVINFGLIYGMSAFGLASNLGIERDAAKHYIERYFARYPGVAHYMEQTRQKAREQGYVETVFGRRLWLSEINSPNGPRRQAAERAAINAPMQGTAADLIKMAMIAVQDWIERQPPGPKLIMQVHDELVLEAPRDRVDHVRTELSRLMTSVARLDVELEVSVGVGANWEQAH